MARTRARFRLSLKDQMTGESLKVELIDAPNESPFAQNPSARRYRVRVNGKAATKVTDVTLTEAFTRLRRWLVRRAKRSEPGKPQKRRLGDKPIASSFCNRAERRGIYPS